MGARQKHTGRFSQSSSVIEKASRLRSLLLIALRTPSPLDMEDPLAAESTRVAAALLVQRCAFAVSLGAPLYNAGDVSACGDIYERTMRSCLLQQPSLLEDMRFIFEDALASCRSLVSASRKAWELRRALDQAIEFATAIVNAHSPASTTDGRGGGAGVYTSPASTPPAVASGWANNNRAVKHSSSGSARPPLRAQHQHQHQELGGTHRDQPGAAVFTVLPRKKGRQEEQPAQIIAMTLDDDAPAAISAAHYSRVACRLLALPSDLIVVILGRLPGRALGLLARSCTNLYRPAHATAAEVVRRYQPSLFAGLGSEAHCSPQWARCLHSIELLTEAVTASPAIPSRPASCARSALGQAPVCGPQLGRRQAPPPPTLPRPSVTWAPRLADILFFGWQVGPCPEPVGTRRRWWDEWGAMRMAETALTTGQEVDFRRFLRGGDHSIKAELRQYATGLTWMIDAGNVRGRAGVGVRVGAGIRGLLHVPMFAQAVAKASPLPALLSLTAGFVLHSTGWAPLHGSTAMLLLACGSAAIGRAIRDRTTEFAASAHALADALRQRALAVSTAAPHTYASIEGTFGVAAADEVS